MSAMFSWHQWQYGWLGCRYSYTHLGGNDIKAFSLSHPLCWQYLVPPQRIRAYENRDNHIKMPLQWDQLPSWQRDNQYILSGYRTSSNSFIKSFASLIYLHNESVNIYSHLIPAVILSFFGISRYKALARRYTSVSTADTMAFGCFFLGAVLCLGISATFHIVQNHSSHVARIANQVDYIGIVLLIVGSFIPSIFYGFYCHPNLQRVYLTMVCPHLSFRSFTSRK
jgi:hypothetical protein